MKDREKRDSDEGNTKRCDREGERESGREEIERKRRFLL